jgi:HSP20 family protein
MKPRPLGGELHCPHNAASSEVDLSCIVRSGAERKSVMAKEKGKEKEKETREVTPWRGPSGLTRLEREMDRMFGDFIGRGWGPRWLPSPWRWPTLRWPREMEMAPAVDVYEEGDDVVVKAELPGLEKKDIEVTLSGNTMTLKGEKKKEEKVEEKDYIYSERSYGSFSRSFELPSEVQADKIKATFKEGILEIHLPKTEAAKKKAVRVQVE